jgi:DNA-binding NtrC family response regulator
MMLTLAQIAANLSSASSGRDHLEYRSRLKLRLSAMAPITSILIVDDTTFDAEVLGSVLRLVFDPDVKVRHIKFARDIRKALMDDMPQLLFLDDRLGHGTSAEVSLNVIRTAGCQLPIIIMSGLLTRARQIELRRLGVADVIHKDDMNVARVAEAILKVVDAPPAG